MYSVQLSSEGGHSMKDFSQFQSVCHVTDWKDAETKKFHDNVTSFVMLKAVALHVRLRSQGGRVHKA